MKSVVFKLYIVLTIFIGSSLASYLGVSLPANSFFSAVHYRTLPLLLLFYFLSTKVYFLTREKLMALLCLCMLIIAGLMNRSAMFAVLVNNAIEPILLIALLRKTNNYVKFIKYTFIVFFFVECSVAWIEVMSRTILFADLSSMNQYNIQYMFDNEMRAYSLHGHPLQNAFLVSLLSYFFLTAKGKVLYRYGLFVIGIVTLFAFNTRSSIYLMTIVGTYIIFKDFRSGVLSKQQKIFVLFFIGLAACFLAFMVVKYQFGNRIFEYSLSAKDDSSNTRYMLLGIIGNLPLKEFLFGMNNGIDLITFKYSLFAIENSLANFIVTNGFIFTFCWCILIYFCLKSINSDKKKFNLSFIIFFCLLNVNNALMAETPILIFYIFALYSLDNLNIHNYETKNTKSNSLLLVRGKSSARFS